MSMAFVVALGCALSWVAPSFAQACGRELLSHDFDIHAGEYKSWTTADIEKAWPNLEARPDFRGELQQPGLIYTEGIERASVGEQNLRLYMPQVRFSAIVLPSSSCVA